MPWVRYDDRYRLHRKIRPLNDRLWRLATEAIMWSASEENLTDGRIERADLTSIRPKATTTDAAELVDRGVWHTASTPCASPTCPPPIKGTGWRIHDYFDYQPSKAKVLADRAAKAERQRRWMAKRGTGPSTVPSPDRPADAPEGDLPDVHGDASVTPAPSPPRPAPKGSGEGTSPSSPPPAKRRDGAGGGQAEDQTPNGSRSSPEWHDLRPPGLLTDDDRARARSGAAAARAALPPRRAEPRRDALAELRAATPDAPATEHPADPPAEEPTDA